MTLRIRLLCLATLAAVAIVSCTATTTLQVRIDLISFLTASADPIETTVPVSTGLNIYLLPGIQIDDVDAGPDENMRLGSEIDTGIGSLPDATDPSVRLLLRGSIHNKSDANSIPAITVRVLLAPSEASDIYAEGTELARVDIPGAGALSTASFESEAIVDHGTPAYDILSAPQARIGVNVGIEPSGSVPVPVSISISDMIINVRVRPFGLIE